MRIPVRIFFLVLLLFSTFYFLPSIFPASAVESTVSSPNYQASQNNQQIPPNLHNYTQQVLLDLSSALTCQLVGIDPSGPDPITGEAKKCLGYDLTGKLGFIKNPAPNGAGQVGGAVGVMGNLIGVLYTPPASSGDYFRYLADNFGLVKPAYAQGVGFEGLKPLLGVWTVMRNMAYLILVLVFLVIGVAIMLRVKIDPRTVMSIQNQIPRILITLILVTFSYAIAGFLIDMMYVTIYLFFNLVSNIGVNMGNFNPTNLQGSNALEAASELGFGNIVNTPAGSFGNIIAHIFDGTIGRSIIGIIGMAVGGFLGGKFGDVLGAIPLIGIPISGVVSLVAMGVISTAFAPQILGLVGASIAFLIIAIAVLWALFRLWFQLIMAYINILIDVAFAPLWILVGALPGVGLGFSSWVRDLLANLLAFPVTIGMFLLGKIFIEGFQKPPTGVVPFVPPLIGNPGDPNAIGALIGLGIILLTPQVVNMIRDAFKAPPFKYASAIGQALGAGGGTLGAIPSYAGRLGTQSLAYGLSTKIGHWLPFGHKGGAQ